MPRLVLHVGCSQSIVGSAKDWKAPSRSGGVLCDASAQVSATCWLWPRHHGLSEELGCDCLLRCASCNPVSLRASPGQCCMMMVAVYLGALHTCRRALARSA